MALQEIKIEEVQMNPFASLMKEWALVTVKQGDKINTLTIGWGGFGVLWQKYVATIYIRPCRYSKELLDRADGFSITFLPEKYRKTLMYLGTASGREEDKIAKSGLTLEFEDGIPYFKEGKLVYITRKIYEDAFHEEQFTDKSIAQKIYPQKDFHAFYLAEIIKVVKPSLENTFRS